MLITQIRSHLSFTILSHINSIDKTTDGDYLISGRHTDTVYLISGQDGSIKWRLGGESSSFALRGFNFSAQHDARMLASNDSNVTVVSFLNNAANEYENSSSTSAGLIVALDHRTQSASIVSQFARPDGFLTDRRGNVQVLDDGNVFICWSESGYISEFDKSGQLALEARFADRRMASYRAFKMTSPLPWPIKPSGRPVLKAHILKTRRYSKRIQPTISIVAFVSWNGATDVSCWKILGRAHNSSNPRPTKTAEDAHEITYSERWTSLAYASRQGFETTIKFDFQPSVSILYAEAVDEAGVVLGQTEEVFLPKMGGNDVEMSTGVMQQPRVVYATSPIFILLPTVLLAAVIFTITVFRREYRVRQSERVSYVKLPQ